MSYNGIVHARQVKGRRLTFRVSGLLWGRNLVMVDDETKSLWSHMLGKSMKGPLAGEVLEVVPSIITDWKSWKSRYPKTTVLAMSRTADHYRRQENWMDPTIVIGLAEGKRAKAWSIEGLSKIRALNDRFSDTAVLAAYGHDSASAVLYDRNVDGRSLTFDIRDGKLIDRETGSEWDIVSGEATTSPMKPRRLKRLPGIISHDDVWQMFHPKMTIWKPNDAAKAN
jgi:hypothetical protein